MVSMLRTQWKKKIDELRDQRLLSYNGTYNEY